MSGALCVAQPTISSTQVAQLQAQLTKPGTSMQQSSEPQLAAEESAVVLADVDQLQTQVEGVEDTIAVLRFRS